MANHTVDCQYCGDDIRTMGFVCSVKQHEDACPDNPKNSPLENSAAAPAWSCPECDAGIDSLLYAEDTSNYFYIRKIENGVAQLGSPQGNDFGNPSNMRLFCTACDHYFLDDGDPTFVDTLKVEY